MGGVERRAKFWLQIVTELKNRGVEDIFIALVVGLKASPKPSRRSPRKRRCNYNIVHLVRY